MANREEMTGQDASKHMTEGTRALLFEGDIEMRIARDGTWFYQGTPIKRERLVRLFASVLMRDEAGEYWLKTPVEKARIQVEDAPFLAVGMTVEGRGSGQRLIFRTNLGEEVTAGPEHRLRIEEDPESGEPRPYVALRDGLGALLTNWPS